MKTPFIRLFENSEIVQNFEWPEEVALAVVVRDGRIVQMQPYHDGENPAGVVARLQALEQVRVPQTLAVYPRLEGYPEIDMGFSEDIVLLSGIETALNLPDSELREEIENFVVNFEFARDMGIAMPQAATPADVAPVKDAPEAEHPAPTKSTQNAQNTPAVPQGFVPLESVAPVPSYLEGLRYSQSANGEAVLTLAASGPTVSLTEGDILLREDRTGFAISASACIANNRPVAEIRLPSAFMPASLVPTGATVHPVVSESGGLVYFTFTGGPVVSKSHKILAGLFAAYFFATVVFFGFWTTGSFINPDNPEGTVDALRNELFK
ncbi:hypothetical protein [Neptunicoccus cionae]|uniref:hypothetical protein n=1 Tax=Neptunicoccus cionae TaxID=2035344 RepID=UPI0011AE2112|nr:hypothetical protein [Amylibacter cionae]